MREDGDGRTLYRPGYPNHEVRQSLNEHLLNALLPESSRRLAAGGPLRELLAANDFEGIEALFRTVFASIPHQWRVNNRIAEYEGCYASVFYSYFAAQGFDLVAQESSARGRADMALRYDGRVDRFEFETVGKAPEGSALARIEERRYADKYRHLGESIHLIGGEFSREERNVAAFEVERA